ncbi:MAG: hypothetical protein R3A79_15455 [Nannocystaceae bacterium]
MELRGASRRQVARRRRVAALACALVLALATPVAAKPAIPPGREADMLALVAPYRPGAPITGDWELRSIHAEVSTIHLWLAGPDDARAHLTLDHLDYAPADAAALEGFALAVVEAPAGSEAAIDALTAAIREADDGSFWTTRGGGDEGDASLPAVVEVDDDAARGRFVSHVLFAWLGDGVVLYAALVLTLLALLARTLTSQATALRRRLGDAALIAAIVGVGAALRAGLAPAVGLTAWPFTRLPWAAHRAYAGPLLAALHPGPLWLSETILATTFALAVLAPAAVFLHARHLLADRRAALVAAAIVAALPLHIRFSASDVVFVASITLSSLTFALLHSAARERSARASLAALLLLAPPLALTFLVRPLNILFAPLLVAALWIDQGSDAREAKPPIPPRRRAALVALVVAVTAGVGIPALLADYGHQVREGLGLSTLTRALGVLVSPSHNALINPSMTPPALALLALVGVGALWVRGRRRLALFLVGWFLAFLAAHAYVIPPDPLMQARYHLHLVVPFVLLASVGGLALVDAARGRGWLARVALALAALSVAAAPAIHAPFITEVDRNEIAEWRWVHERRAAIPAGCTILEHVVDGVGPRFPRVGAYAQGLAAHARWTVLTYRDAAELDAPPLRDLLRAPPACLFVYEGLPCAAFKPRGAPIAPACAALREALDLEELGRLERASATYDENLRGSLAPGDPVVFRLLRARDGR